MSSSSGSVSPLDISYGTSGLMPYSPTDHNLEEEDEEDDEDMDLHLNNEVRLDSAAALDLSICQTPLDLSLPSARRRHQ